GVRLPALGMIRTGPPDGGSPPRYIAAVGALAPPPRLRAGRLLLLLAGLVVLGCASPSDKTARSAPADLSGEWRTVPPDSVDVDGSGVARALTSAETVAGLESVVIVRRGRLIGERYLGTASSEQIHSIRSVTKSVISLLVGQAIARGVFQGTSVRL